jgi:hypothetical protein
MGYEIKQGQTAQPLVFLLVSSTDHISGLTGATPAVTLSKNGGAFASPAGSVTEIGNGWYKVAGNAADSGTLGPLLLHATATGADPVDDRYEVVAYDPQTVSQGLVLAKTTNITGFNDIAATAVVSGGAIATSNGSVSRVTLVDGCQNNADMRGTDNAYTGTPPTVGQITADIDAHSTQLAAIAADASTAATEATAANSALTAGVTVETNNDKTGYSLTSVYDPAKTAAQAGDAMTVDLTQAIPTTNTAQTIGDCLNAARADGFGRWTKSGMTLTLYAADGSTPVRVFTLDDSDAPTSRT